MSHKKVLNSLSKENKDKLLDYASDAVLTVYEAKLVTIHLDYMDAFLNYYEENIKEAEIDAKAFILDYPLDFANSLCYDFYMVTR